MKASVKAIKEMRVMGWGDFKHKLIRLGVITSPDDDVPAEWQRAFIKTFRGQNETVR